MPGEFFGLVGVNGAGKTTCIKGLLDFSRPDAGDIQLFGLPCTETSARQRVAYLPERFLPPYHLTGIGFLTYISALHGIRPSRDEMEALSRALDLAPKALDRPVRDYSKGMAQKLGLVGCFLSRKDLLILDEPMSGLDPKARVLVKRHLQSLRESKTTVFFSTHMLFDVEALCDRMGILHEGELRFVGTPAECCAAYDAPDLEEAYLRCISAGGPAASVASSA